MKVLATSDMQLNKWRNAHLQVAQKWHDGGPHIAMIHVRGPFHEEKHSHICVSW